MKKQKTDNVIDMTERIQEPSAIERVKHLKVRFDLERAKVGLSASLLSIVVLVTLANNNMLNPNAQPQSSAPSSGRGIASVGTGTSDAEDSFVRSMAKKELTGGAAIGRAPSPIEKLAFGFLEGHYAVRLENGKLAELQISQDQSAKQIDDLRKFLESNRDVMPVSFDKPVKIQSASTASGIRETWQLVNSLSRPMAHVEAQFDNAGHLLAMRVSMLNVASK